MKVTKNSNPSRNIEKEYFWQFDSNNRRELGTRTFDVELIWLRVDLRRLSLVIKTVTYKIKEDLTSWALSVEKRLL